MSAASQEARSGVERRRWFAAASAAVERRQASASRWTRAAPPPLSFSASGGCRWGCGGWTYASVGVPPSWFHAPGAIEMKPVPPPAAIRRDRVRSFSFFVEQSSGASAPRERFYVVIASASEAIQLWARGSIAWSRSLSSGRPLRAGPVGSGAVSGKGKATACAA